MINKQEVVCFMYKNKKDLKIIIHFNLVIVLYYFLLKLLNILRNGFPKHLMDNHLDFWMLFNNYNKYK